MDNHTYHKRKLIVLDLDETLIHSVQQSNDNQILDNTDMSNVETYETDFSWSHATVSYKVYVRPYVKEFLDFCFENFDVGVWTAATQDYADKIVPLVFKHRVPIFVFTRERCTTKTDNRDYLLYPLTDTVKKLQKVKRRKFNGKRYNINNILVIDDTPSTFKCNYGNAIQISEWNGNTHDVELQLLIRYIKTILDFPFRTIEKRNWKEQVIGQSM